MLFHAGVPRPLVTQVLLQASARSDEPYILESAKLTAVARQGRWSLGYPSGGAGGYSLREPELLSMAANWGPGWPARWPRWANIHL